MAGIISPPPIHYAANAENRDQPKPYHRGHKEKAEDTGSSAFAVLIASASQWLAQKRWRRSVRWFRRNVCPPASCPQAIRPLWRKGWLEPDGRKHQKGRCCAAC